MGDATPSSRGCPAALAAKARTLGRRVAAETRVELGILRTQWWVILLCAIFQYVHGIFTQLAYRVHVPAPEPLPDLGFKVLPELDLHWVSEAVFYTLFASVIAWTFSPFLTRRPTFTTAGLFAAALPAFVLCQVLRIASFMATWLPAPAPHCRAGTPTERLAPPPHWWGWVAVDVVRQSSMSCGDLIFSSHLIYVLGLTLVYTIWGAWKVLKAAAWTAAAAISLLIIASRKHYTVDVVIAWYTVPLAFHALRGTARWKRLAGRPDAGLPEVNEAAGVAGPSNGDGPVAVVVENGHGAPPGASSLNIGRASAKSESDGVGGRSRRWLGWLPGGRRAGGGA